VGLDVDGLVYWSQTDESADVRVYQENRGHKSWNMLVQNREELGRSTLVLLQFLEL
jgi:hypothetical protein